MTELEQPMAHVEAQLHALALALRANDALALESAATGLHESLSRAVERFRSAARRGDVPAPLRERLERFVEYYPSVLNAGRQRPTVVDMRYPNGFALRVNTLAAAPASESKGTP